MIAYLNGILQQKTEDECIIDVNGVGYRVEISTQTLETLPEKGGKLKLLIYHHITDNDQRLFGFASNKEKNLFERLITVKGIGPKLGLTTLSGMPAPALMEAIVTQDIKTLSTISGIGKKTAERMVLELKDKLFDESQPSVVSGSIETRSKREEAVSALEALGFSKKQASQAVNQISGKKPKATVSEIVKEALTTLK
ncbi:Holliday junction branch migration protein RuvA [Rhodohalobacter sulfatireducens]|uniref:Holliday junction branch migration complex subunit RuvA n=1 Tax=Rhodohalobacter sulfatireducens TaxID=2911366 RepID=A0ABS9K8L4_9BACT|nr:Holliday junction branch migration protein RuvA [Rhodohalobacter sulfatireducens]MCG2587195.1 Holliday junction branch migration protein RuvA [Rhodohalobacter sulfatireducens]MDR9408629.1 Holliday junction branch migration protein RuvA [Balneolaceae bacterium]